MHKNNRFFLLFFNKVCSGVSEDLRFDLRVRFEGVVYFRCLNNCLARLKLKLAGKTECVCVCVCESASSYFAHSQAHPHHSHNALKLTL